MPSTRGFTLIELLIVIAIISILAVIGIVVLKGVTSGARDSQRKEDVDAIAKAYEMKVNAGRYARIADSDFASGKKPQDPSKGDYFNYLASDGSGYKICASLDSNPSSYCNTPAANCFCKSSTQDTISSNSTADDSSTNFGSGPGGSSQQSCDTNGTLLTGLVGYWKMDDNVSGNAKSLADASGNNNIGTTYYGANATGMDCTVTGQSGQFGKACQFDGIDDYIDAGNSVTVNFGNAQPFTLEAWVNLSGTLTRQHIIAKGRIGAGPPFTDLSYSLGVLYYSVTDQRLQFQIYHSGNTTSVVSYDYTDGFRFNLGNWHHYVAEWDGTTNTNGMKIYMDGNLVKQGTASSAIVQQSTAHLGIGRDLQYPIDTINGTIDDVRIYNKALSDPEISALYNSGNGCIY